MFLCVLTHSILLSDIKPTLETPDSEPAEQITAEEAEHRRAMEYAEDDENEPEEIHVREAAVSIPRIPRVKSSDGKVRITLFVKSISYIWV
jgi:hypothetical protein